MIEESGVDGSKKLAWCGKCKVLCDVALPGRCRECGTVLRRPAKKELVDGLYREYGSSLRGFVHRAAVRRGLSESQLDFDGVVHEAFEALLCSDSRIDNERGWLFVVARRLVENVAVRRGQHLEGGPAEAARNGIARWASVAPRASTEDICEVRQILEEIAKLPDKQKIAVYLSKVQGWKHAEIGDYLRCATSTVGVHVHRGIAKLRKVGGVVASVVGATFVVGVGQLSPRDDNRFLGPLRRL